MSPGGSSWPSDMLLHLSLPPEPPLLSDPGPPGPSCHQRWGLHSRLRPIPQGPLSSPTSPPGLCGGGWVQAACPLSPALAGIVCLVVTIMYWSGWEMGAVEAISLSILVGSSVDYCVHLVEGYLLAGENLPPHQAEVSALPALPHASAVPSAAEGPPRPAGHAWCPTPNQTVF